MKLPEFNLFSDESARIFLIFLSICPNFHGLSKIWGGGVAPLALMSRTPMFRAMFAKGFPFVNRNSPGLFKLLEIFVITSIFMLFIYTHMLFI